MGLNSIKSGLIRFNRVIIICAIAAIKHPTKNELDRARIINKNNKMKPRGFSNVDLIFSLVMILMFLKKE